MPWKTTIQLPVETAGGLIELFVLPDQELPVQPSRGVCLIGKRIPHVADPDSDIHNVIMQVTYDFDTGVLYSTVQGFARPSDDYTDVLKELRALDPKWQYVPPDKHGVGRRQQRLAGEQQQGFDPNAFN